MQRHLEIDLCISVLNKANQGHIRRQLLWHVYAVENVCLFLCIQDKNITLHHGHHHFFPDLSWSLIGQFLSYERVMRRAPVRSRTLSLLCRLVPYVCSLSTTTSRQIIALRNFIGAHLIQVMKEHKLFPHITATWGEGNVFI